MTKGILIRLNPRLISYIETCGGAGSSGLPAFLTGI
jgi:hypothetical protein